MIIARIIGAVTAGWLLLFPAPGLSPGPQAAVSTFSTFSAPPPPPPPSAVPPSRPSGVPSGILVPPRLPPNLVPPPPPAGSVAVTDPALVVPNQILALYNTAAEAATGSNTIAPTGYGVLAQTALPALAYVMVTYSLPPGVTLDNALVALQAQFPAATFAPNNLYDLAAGGSGDPAGLISWSTQSPNCGTGISVGVIDTQVDTKVATLKAHDIRARSFVSDPRPPTNHGTQVSSILVGTRHNGSVAGLMPRGRIFAAGVFEHMSNGAVRANTAAIAAGMDWVVGEKVAVVNMSFAGPINMALLAIVTRAAERNVLMVAAAGNDGPTSPPLFPAAFPKVIAVSAIDGERRPYAYNVQGKHIAFTAPGVDLPLPVAEQGGRVDLISGTSFAAPYVTGVVALWRHTQPSGGYADAVKQLAARAVPMRAGEPDPIFGHGLIQSPGPCS